MKFESLQNKLRETLLDRIAGEGLTGLALARQTGFKQAHISNFLNKKRGLSIEGMDRILEVQDLSVLDLLDPQEINRRATSLHSNDNDFENVPIVENTIAIQPLIMRLNVSEVSRFRRSFLRRLRPEMEGNRKDWGRFIALKVDGREGMSMYPRLLPGATVLIDRYYNSLKSYRRTESNMYAVNKRGVCTVKYVEVAGQNLLLRPHNSAYPVEVLSLPAGKKASHYIIGRVCYVGIET